MVMVSPAIIPITLKIGDEHVLSAKLTFDMDIQRRLFDGVRDVGEWHITPHGDMDKRIWESFTEKRFSDFLRLLAEMIDEGK